MNPRFRSTLLVLTIAVIAMSAATPCAAERGRTLNDYRFVPSGLPDPFIITSFSTNLGVAVATDVDVPIIVIEDTPPDTLVSVTGNLLFVIASVDYQYAVHERATLRAHMHGGSRLGTGGSALLAQGVTAFTGVRIGTTVELWRTERFLLGGLADLDYSNKLVVDLVQFADDVLAGNTENASIMVEDSGATVYGGLSSAWAFNPWSGLIGVAQAGYTGTELVDDSFVWKIAGGYSLDLGQRGKVPIGFSGTIEADHLKPLANTNGIAYGSNLGIFYTGRDDLNVGIDLGWVRLPLANRDIVINPFAFNVVMKYFF